MTRNEISDLARSNIISVTFTKKNGETRTMKCTLKEEYIDSQVKESTSVRKPNYDVLPVWDLDINEWRSFRIDSVKGVEIDVLIERIPGVSKRYKS